MRDFTSYQRRFDLSQEILLEKGVIRHRRSMPLVAKAMWTLGFSTPVGLFGSFRSNVLFFGVGWGAVMWLTSWREKDMPIGIEIVTSIVISLLFGLWMAIYFRWRARKLGLPAWLELTAKNVPGSTAPR